MGFFSPKSAIIRYKICNCLLSYWR